MEDDLVLTGKVISGVGQGAFFTQIDWVQKQCDQKLGFKPYPGTLNLEISQECLPMIKSLDKERRIELISPDPKFCNATVFPVTLQEINGAIIMPEEQVRVHADNVIEIVAAVNLKQSLNVKDGDFVTVIVITAP
jgi:CTP-dependent riboflavin kinase